MSAIFLLPVCKLQLQLQSYSVFICWYVTWPCDLEQLSFMASHVTNLATVWVITFPIGYHWKCVRGYCACAESRDSCVGGQKQLIHFFVFSTLICLFTTQLRWLYDDMALEVDTDMYNILLRPPSPCVHPTNQICVVMLYPNLHASGVFYLSVCSSTVKFVLTNSLRRRWHLAAVVKVVMCSRGLWGRDAQKYRFSVSLHTKTTFQAHSTSISSTWCRMFLKSKH